MLDVLTPNVLVGVEDVDVAGARGVRLRGDGAREWSVLDERVDRQGLTGLEVDADPHGEPREPLHQLSAIGHGRTA